MNRYHKIAKTNVISSQEFPGQLRKLFAALALPSLLGACAASSPVVAPSSSHKSLLPDAKLGPEDSDWRGLNLSPDQQKLSPISQIAIIESILARKRADAEFAAATPPKVAPGHDGRGFGSKSFGAFRSGRLTDYSNSKDGGVWGRIRRGLALTNEEHERIYSEEALFSRSPGTVEILARNAEPFLLFLADELERRGLPLDLVMVPMIESAFQTNALSPKKAAGIWQLMPETGQQHGLQLTDSYDGRYDIHASTHAALNHLAHLRSVYQGDWLLALAAYNAGEGTVNRALESNHKARRGLSFWDLDLPNETEAYVPKILALSRLIADPQGHGIRLPKGSGLPYLARIQVNGVVPLAGAAIAAGMPEDEFYAYNPAFKPGTIPQAPFHLLLPLDRAEALVAQLPEAHLVSQRRYVVKRGDTLVVIAKRHGVSQNKLALWNGLKANSAVTPGQQLEIFPVSRT